MKIKRFFCVFCALVLMLSAAGCGSMPQGNQADTDAVKAAVEKFRACESFTVAQHINWQESVNVDNDKQLYNAVNEMEISFISGEQPQMISYAMTKVENGGSTVEQSSISYILPENGGYAEYVNDGSSWVKVTSDNSGPLASISAASFVNAFFTDFISFAKVGEETLDSGKATRNEGALSGEALVAMLETNGQLADLSSMSEKSQATIRENLIKDLDYLTVSVWLDENSGYPVRFEVNLTEILDDLNRSISKSLGNKVNNEWAITEYVLSMSASDFNALTEIVLPAEAANAVPYEAA